MNLRTAKKIKGSLEQRWKCRIEIAKDWTNYLKIFPDEVDVKRGRWILNMFIDSIIEQLHEPVFYWDFNEGCLVVYGKG